MFVDYFYSYHMLFHVGCHNYAQYSALNKFLIFFAELRQEVRLLHSFQSLCRVVVLLRSFNTEAFAAVGIYLNVVLICKSVVSKVMTQGAHKAAKNVDLV